MLEGFFLKMVPFYLYIVLGFIAGKHLKAKKETLASILIYLIAPIIIFNGALMAKLDFNYLSLPFLYLIICCLICLLFYSIGTFFLKGPIKNILAFTSGSANTGYFGLPVIIALLGEEYVPIAVLIILGFIVYENTLGFFIVAKGTHTIKESLTKLARLPAIYAFALGILLNLLGIVPVDIYLDSMETIKGAYALFGMMIIGMAISELDSFKVDLKFTGLAFLAKFIVWPIITFSLVFIDAYFLGFYGKNIHEVMIIYSLVPLAANTVSYATELNTHPKESALAVFLSTIFALIYIPVMTSIFL